MTIKNLLLLFLLLPLPFSYASKLFLSNNDSVISAQQAYDRLHGKEEALLLDKTIDTLQTFHFEQGKFYEVLGAYVMEQKQEVTADNTLVFITSPKQHVTRKKLVDTAHQLAKHFDQESVALFVNNKQGNDLDVVIKFNKTKPSYSELQKKLPALKANQLSAFSVYFQGNENDLNKGKITSIEWLTTPEKVSFLESLFPDASLETYHGNASLVFQDGRTEPIL